MPHARRRSSRSPDRGPADTVAPDGSPVALYARLPPAGEPEIIHAAIPAGSAILELGAGTGRITHELIRLGHRVTAVDESAAMLARVRGAETVRARIEDLRLGRRFPVVLLGSHLVNTGDAEQARRFLETCARHVAADGSVLIERHPPEWARSVVVTTTERDGIVFVLDSIEREADRLSAVVTYGADGQEWRHRFTARILDDGALSAELEEVGLRLDRWLDDRRAWCLAKLR